MAVRLPFQKRKQLERDLDHITEEMYKRNRELAETNKTLSLLRTIDTLVLDSHEPLPAVCARIAQAVTEAAEYSFVGIFTRSPHLTHELLLQGASLHDQFSKQPLQLAKPLRLKITDAWFRGIEPSRLFSLGERENSQLAKFTNYSPADVTNLRRQLPIRSLYMVKLLARNKLVGVIMVGFVNPVDQINESHTLLMDRLSESIGVALDSKLLFEENQRVLRQLRESNVKLKALDETKDDFISMASHQLRTPLTSVKGYLSMVLEEDAGKLTKAQREMLGQAFISSQRMVYLIADLLNVSRLKTGKFAITPTPVNLATMVQEELNQLQDTAAGRSLTLQYDKPEDFPELMLDETKIRQVIMNFADNAIYYTPAGGNIVVRLLDKPHSIELLIEDDGIGVPKSEQPHLFTKFYRAGNARKARPDGTGLGLFMAKKVIIAQGGSILFHSKEGQGSSFGFTFSKTTVGLPVPNPTSPSKQVAKAKA